MENRSVYFAALSPQTDIPEILTFLRETAKNSSCSQEKLLALEGTALEFAVWGEPKALHAFDLQINQLNYEKGKRIHHVSLLGELPNAA